VLSVLRKNVLPRLLRKDVLQQLLRENHVRLLLSLLRRVRPLLPLLQEVLQRRRRRLDAQPAWRQKQKSSLTPKQTEKQITSTWRNLLVHIKMNCVKLNSNNSPFWYLDMNKFQKVLKYNDIIWL
jgi:hypothetical protein